MSHQIYYTSAPQGLKRGTSGFCTVAASDNIPKPLWDRLESLSAYRHQFAPGDSAHSQNPVSFAHWTLSVANKTYHVLSRVCDSGVDHTHRTNAFAHHLVLEPADMESAPGGPAWLLDQPGVMAGLWDGQVGAIPPARLPSGDARARICSHWAALTGDPGWGGHLADSFVKAPARPICILFAPGQDVLPLIAETLALLPPQARWNITFNTYFTSMPASATCLWRCCLAGTPAAQVALRYAANGLVLDLTDRARLPALPEGIYATAARTGQSPMAAKPAAPARRPAAAAVAPPAGSKLDRAKAKPPIDDEDDELEKNRDKFFDFAAQEAEFQASNGGQYDLADDPQSADNPPPGLVSASAAAATPTPVGGIRKKAVSLRRADDDLFAQEREADRAAAKRRKQIMWMFMGAVGALAVGTVVIYLLQNTTRLPEPPPPRRTVQPGADNNPSTRLNLPETNIAPVPINTQTEPLASQTAPAPQTQVVETQNATTLATAPTTPPAPVFPDTIALAAAITRPDVSSGMGERSQPFPLRPADLDTPNAITALALHLPQRMKTGAVAPANDNTYASDTLGTFAATPAVRLGKPGVAYTWKAAGPGQPLEFAFILFDKTKPGLEIQWKAGAILQLSRANPDLFPSAYWLLQNSAVELASPRKPPQRVAFPAFDPPPISFKAAASPINWPVELPRDATVVPPKLASLPAGWDANWYMDWDEKDAALRKPTNASQVLKFKKNAGGTDVLFTLSFKPGLARVESNFTKNLDGLKSDLARNQAELNSAEAAVQDAILKLEGTGIDIAKDPGGAERLTRRDIAKKNVDELKQAIAAYDELTAFNVEFDSAEGVHLATVKFKQGE